MSDILDSVRYIPCHPSNHGGARTAEDIRYLVYHYTGNDGDHDTNNAIYYRDNVISTSAHYFVDDDSITRSVDDLTIAWAVGGTKWSDCGVTGGGSLYGVVTNKNSISIDIQKSYHTTLIAFFCLIFFFKLKFFFYFHTT